MLDRFLIEHCAPTLAGVKTANLFTCPFYSDEALSRLLHEQNSLLNRFGVSLDVLQKKGGRALIYVYRICSLSSDLSRSEARAILQDYGYADLSPDACLIRLKERFREQNGFPHEIGLFLGYPPKDVSGFIKNSGQNYMCAGCWKVYGDVCTAQCCFTRYAQCRKHYMRQFASGKTVAQLTVAV